MKIILNWILGAIAITIAAYLLPGVHLAGVLPALVVAIVLGLINSFIRPLLIILTLPINILSLGLFTLVINALLIQLTSLLVPGFAIDNFWWALVFGVVLFFINLALGVKNRIPAN